MPIASGVMVLTLVIRNNHFIEGSPVEAEIISKDDLVLDRLLVTTGESSKKSSAIRSRTKRTR